MAHGTKPFLQVTFPEDVTVKRVTILGNRDPKWLKGYTILAGTIELFDAAGATRKWALPIDSPNIGVHLLGTCRMGDPKNSVVDKFHRAHDVPNLFIVDGSSFVTSGRNQPTCTIQALAYRAADHIAKAAKAGNIPTSL